MKMGYKVDTLKNKEAFKDTRDLGSAEKVFPLLFRLLNVLGLSLAKRDEFGSYQVAKWRLIPLLCLAGIMTWTIVHYIVYVSNGKTKFIDIVVYLNYIASAAHLFAFVWMNFLKKYEYCNFLQALPVTPSHAKYRRYFLELMLLLYTTVSFYFYPWSATSKDPLKIVLGIITVLVLPVIPAFVDLQACCLIRAVVEAHKDLVRKIQENPREGKPGTHISEQQANGTFISVLPFLAEEKIGHAGLGEESWAEPGTGAIRVVKVRDHTNYLHSLVTGYNQ
ncbi:hypothetical protein SK128_014335, partial [Halocaridina rubra]